jgi:hypothetical protein
MFVSATPCLATLLSNPHEKHEQSHLFLLSDANEEIPMIHI